MASYDPNPVQKYPSNLAIIESSLILQLCRRLVFIQRLRNSCKCPPTTLA
jgi:hypothetical protein